MTKDGPYVIVLNIVYEVFCDNAKCIVLQQRYCSYSFVLTVSYLFDKKKKDILVLWSNSSSFSLGYWFTIGEVLSNSSHGKTLCLLSSMCALGPWSECYAFSHACALETGPGKDSFYLLHCKHTLMFLLYTVYLYSKHTLMFLSYTVYTYRKQRLIQTNCLANSVYSLSYDCVCCRPIYYFYTVQV